MFGMSKTGNIIILFIFKSAVHSRQKSKERSNNYNTRSLNHMIHNPEKHKQTGL